MSTASPSRARVLAVRDRKSTRLNSSHTEIYTLSLHDALPISFGRGREHHQPGRDDGITQREDEHGEPEPRARFGGARSEEHTSELQSHRDLHSFPTRRSSDLLRARPRTSPAGPR